VARIFVDTNVLFPFSVMDLLLALSEDGVHTVVWTDALLDEWERVIVDEQRRTPETAAAITAAIRSFFANSKVELADYEHLLDEMPGPDTDDHHHSAAAISGGATVLLTHNRADFPTKPLAQRACESPIQTPTSASWPMNSPTRWTPPSNASPATGRPDELQPDAGEGDQGGWPAQPQLPRAS